MLLAATLAGACGSSAGREVRLPEEHAGGSLVLIVLDTLRNDHTSLGQYRRDTTPFLDSLGAEGVVFDRAYANASWTRASVATLFTSRLPASHGCENREGRLSPELSTLAELLHAAGFRTHAIVANANLHPAWGFDQGFDEYQTSWIGAETNSAGKTDARMFVPAVRLAAAELGSKSFLYLHLMDPHEPLHAHPETDFDPGYAGPYEGSKEGLDPYRFQRPPDEGYRRIIDLYDGEIAWMDLHLRDIFAELGAAGILESAWVVVTSDHGEGLWDHRTLGHGHEVFEEQLRVPLIVRPPGGLERGVRVGEPVALLDLAPTLLELLGLAVPPDFEGRSWAPFLRGRAEAPDAPIIVDEKLEAADLAAVIFGADKLVVDRQRGFERYFDLEENPDEEVTRAYDSRRDDVEAPRELPGLRRMLQLALERAAARRPAPTTSDVPAEVRRQLEALGYGGTAASGEDD